MADFSQGTTEVCSVCKTEYPTCMTCKKYGSKHKHSLDSEKSRNAHDNAGYVNDVGNSQSHWNQKEWNKKSNKTLFYFYYYFQISMWFAKTFLFSLLGTNTGFNMGNIKSPPNDPFSTRSGALSTNQFESNLLCSCTCIRRPQQ